MTILIWFFIYFLQVRGTPASGKTTLSHLLGHHILKQDSNVNVIFLDLWPYDDVKKEGGYRPYLRSKGWEENVETVFIFDNGETTYVDQSLWFGFFKSIQGYRGLHAIVFTSRGSPSTSLIGPTPFNVTEPQMVTLRAIQHQDDLPAVGLFFSQDEFDDFISKTYPLQECRFDSSFLDYVFNVTSGHAGAIHDLLSVIAAHDVGLCYVNRTSDLTLYFSRIGVSGTAPGKNTPFVYLRNKSVYVIS